VTEFLAEYGLFLAKAITLVVVILLLIGGAIMLASRGRDMGREQLEIKKINEKFEQMAETVKTAILSKEALKKSLKAEKQQKKAEAKQLKEGSVEARKRIFVINFDGDIKASPLASLRQEITAILTVATPEDEVFLRLQSGGGLVHAYGLAASQLMRVKDKKIPLTVCVDKIAASGGYMMACVADRIIAAPFAIIGSIGVIAQLPNFHKLLKKHDIDFEQLTAGEFKRTITMFGENTDKARQKFQEELEDMHLLFKEFIQQHRPIVDLNRIATGEHWPASRALELKLVDELKTSDDYLLENCQHKELYEICYSIKRPLGVRMGWFIQNTLERIFHPPLA
jgi:serine protease SohB